VETATMLLKFTNKMTMALQQMLEQGKRAGGVPSVIEINTNEAFDILKEICLIPNNLVLGYTIQNSKDKISQRLLLNQKAVSDNLIADYVVMWETGEWSVQFSNTPIKIVKSTLQKQQLNEFAV
jgi:hypothetical protein